MNESHKIHDLKILPKYFNAVLKGLKTFELRKDDRDYEVGDYLRLREWDEEYTGNFTTVRVLGILQNCPEYGLMDGYCIMSIEKVDAYE